VILWIKIIKNVIDIDINMMISIHSTAENCIDQRGCRINDGPW